MDWPKAKTILIVSFLLVDLYLAWLVFFPQDQSSQFLNSQDVQALATVGQHFGVNLAAAPIPLAVGSAPPLTLAEQPMGQDAAEAYAVIWLGQDGKLCRASPNVYVFSDDQWELRVTESSFYVDLELRPLHELTAGLSGNEQDNVWLARQFLTDHLGSKLVSELRSGMVIKAAKQGQYLIEFNSLYNDLPIFTDYYRLAVSSGKVSALTARISRSTKAAGPRIQLVTGDRPFKRLLAQLGIQEAEQVAILDLRLGYGLVPGDERTLQPVWRIISTIPGQEEIVMPAGRSYWGDETN
jgi:hypothetical protein